MKLRHKVMALTVLMASLPLAVVILLSGREIGSRFQERDDELVAARMRSALTDLESRNLSLAVLLDALAEAVRGDNRFRLALTGHAPEDHAYLDDYALRQSSLMRLDVLWILDEAGNLLSSAPLTGARGTQAPLLPTLLANTAEGRALMEIRGANGPFLSLVRARPLDLGDRTLQLVAGARLDRSQLTAWRQRDGLDAALVWPGGALAATAAFEELCRDLGAPDRIVYALQRQGAIVHRESMPFIAGGDLQSAWLIMTADQSDLHGFLAAVRARLWLLMVLAALVSALLAIGLTSRLTRPLAELADRTSSVDLDRLDVDFGSDRGDEVGELGRLLGEMTLRLRQGVDNLRAAEQRATLGEVARQVNHDIRNGIAPLRHVLRHLRETAVEEPDQLAGILQERWPHLEEGLSYLQQLADRYAQLTPVAELEPCHLDRIVQDVMLDLQAVTRENPVELVNHVPGNLPMLVADPVALRRIFTNLLRNALDSLREEGGRITVDATVDEDPGLGEPRLLISVSDNGCGIPPADLERIFEDFYTTRTGGTGLGLSNVRRLVGDLGGRIRVQSEPGAGSTFILSVPTTAAEGGRP